ncbi:MAG: hypothetical protein EXR64_05665 [Dehalococcoidia bacterium]|nr:hypothetical protein [Dehalococcoidia bacterium]
MRIGIDFDGVLAHTMPAMVAYAAEHIGIALSEAECMRPGGPIRLGEAGYVALVRDTHETPYALTFASTEVTFEALQRLSEAHEVFVVTNRAGAALARAEEWLTARSMRAMLSDLVSASTGAGKADAARRLGLDVLLDDWPENLVGLDAATQPVLWSASYNLDASLPAGVRRVHGWAAFAEAIERG